MKSLNMLELFKGTGSVGKVFKKDFNIISLDMESKYNPTIHIDILKWDYKKFYETTKFLPDFIWASPPCNTYSVLAYQYKERDTKTAEPFSDRAKLGTKILYKTLSIINYFQKLNPRLLYVIENPRGMMRLDKKMRKYKDDGSTTILNSTLYCYYGDNRRKPTDFFSNFNLYLQPIEKQCPNTTTNVADLSLNERYMIPSKLIKQILNEFLKKYQ
jgi:hypothetical protein